MTPKQVQTLNHRRRASQNLSYLCWILNPLPRRRHQTQILHQIHLRPLPRKREIKDSWQDPSFWTILSRLHILLRQKKVKCYHHAVWSFLMRNCTEYRANFPKTSIFARIRDVCTNDVGKKSRCIPFVGSGALRNEFVDGCVGWYSSSLGRNGASDGLVTPSIGCGYGGYRRYGKSSWVLPYLAWEGRQQA